jgi:hypothetical protein
MPLDAGSHACQSRGVKSCGSSGSQDLAFPGWLGRAGRLERVFFVPVVLDVRDVAVRHGDVLEDEGFVAATVVGDPVNADYKRPLSGLDELVGS